MLKRGSLRSYLLIFIILLLSLGFFIHIIQFVFGAEASPTGTIGLIPQICSAQNTVTTQFLFNSTCDGTYNKLCGSGNDHISCDDTNLEQHQAGRESGAGGGPRYGGINASYFNSSITDCDSITKVELCYKVWIDSGDSGYTCRLHVDNDEPASFVGVTNFVCATSEPSSITCVDVTSNETDWACSNFFTSSGNRTRAVAQAADEAGGANSDAFDIDVLYFNVTYTLADTSPPLVDLQSPANTTWLGNTSVQFVFNVTDAGSGIQNCSVYTNESGSWVLEQSNNSVITEGSNYTVIHDLGSGSYLWNAICYDNSNNKNNAFDNANWTVKVDLPPNWSNPINQTPTTYNISNLSYFNVTWGDDLAVNTVFIEANFTGSFVNYSMNIVSGNTLNGIWNYSRVLPAGQFQWRSVANDSNNQLNATIYYNFTISRATTQTNLFLNSSQNNISVLQNELVNHTGVLVSGGDSQSIQLLRDGTVFDSGNSPVINISNYTTAGTFNITAIYNGSENFSGSFAIWFVKVNSTADTDNPLVDLQSPANSTWLGNTSVQFVFNTTDAGSNIRNCSIYTNETGSWILEESNSSSITEESNYTIVHNVGNGGRASYLWNVVCYDDSSNKNSAFDTANWTVTIDLPPNWSNAANQTPVNYSSTQISFFNVSWSDDNSVNKAFIEANFTGSFVNYSMNLITGNIYNYSQILPAGTFQWKSYANDSNNQFNVTSAYIFTINRSNSNVTLELNGTRGNFSILQNHFANHTGETIIGDTVNIELLRDGTVFDNGASLLVNVSSYSNAGTFNITARYNQTQNFTASFEVWFIQVNETNPPLVDLQAPANNTWSTNQSVQFIFNITDAASGIYNCSVYTNETGSWILEQSNNSVITEGSNYTITHDVPNGAFLWNVVCYDDSSTKNNAFDNANWTVRVLDTTPPEFSNIISFPTCPATYNSSNSFQFNVTWSEPNSSIGQALFEHNFTGSFQNVSSSGNKSNQYFLNQGNLVAGTHNWKSFANNTDGFGNNSMSYQTCIVNRANPSLSLFLNSSQANISILRTGFVNITGVRDVGDPLNIDLLQDGTPFASGPSPLINIKQFNTTGNINITVRYNQTQNYTASIKTFFVQVNDTFPNWSNPVNQTPTTYNITNLSYFNVTWGDDLVVNTVFIEANFTGTFTNYTMNRITGDAKNGIWNYSQVLPAGQFQWRSVANDSNNQLNATIYYNFTISRATSNVTLELNGTRGNISILQNGFVNHTGETIDGDVQNISLLRDGTVFAFGASPLINISSYTAAGTFNITIRYNQTQNYTASSEIWFVIVNETIPPLVDLKSPANNTWLGNISVQFVFNVTDANSGIQNCSLYTNETGSWIVEESNTSIVEDISQTVTHNLNSGSYLWNFRCYDDSGPKNEAFDTANWTVKVDLPPNWSDPINQTPTTYNISTKSYFNVSWNDDNSVSQVLIEVNFTGTSTNYSMNLITSNRYNYSQVLPAGTFQWKSYANDSNNQFNVTSSYVFIINRAASNVTLELNGTRGNFTVNKSDFVNHTGETIDGDVQNISLLRDGTVFAFGASPLINISAYSTLGTFNITLRYNQTQNFTASFETWFVIVNDNILPLVDLKSPDNLTTQWTANTSIQFVFNTTDADLAISNCSVYTNETGSWILEESNSSSITGGVNYTITHQITTGNGIYLWNVRCYDNSTYFNNAFDNANWTVDLNVTQDLSSPLVDLKSPANDTWDASDQVEFVFNTTDIDSGIQNCSLYTNETGSWILEQSNNSVITEGVDYTIIHTMNDGSYLWNLRCYDNSTNRNNAFDNANWTVKVSVPEAPPAGGGGGGGGGGGDEEDEPPDEEEEEEEPPEEEGYVGLILDIPPGINKNYTQKEIEIISREIIKWVDKYRDQMVDCTAGLCKIDPTEEQLSEIQLELEKYGLSLSFVEILRWARVYLDKIGVTAGVVGIGAGDLFLKLSSLFTALLILILIINGAWYVYFNRLVKGFDKIDRKVKKFEINKERKGQKSFEKIAKGGKIGRFGEYQEADNFKDYEKTWGEDGESDETEETNSFDDYEKTWGDD